MSALWEELRPVLVPALIAVAVGGAVGPTALFVINAAPNPGVALLVSLFVMPAGWLLAGLSALGVGLPIYMMMRSVGLRLHWWGGVLLGVFVAMIPISYISLYIWLSLLRGKPEPGWDWFEVLKWHGPFPLAGAVAGFAFWRALPPAEAKA